MAEAPDYGTRTLPHDDVAEQSVLGGMMLSKDAIADVVEQIVGADFYKPAHETIYEAIITLYGHGQPADAVTVADELNKRGELNKVGGATYLHSLISSVPTAANAGFYAEIVSEKAVLRRLVEAGTKIAQMGYMADGEVSGLVDSAQVEIYNVTDGRKSEDYVSLKEALDTTVDEIEANSSRKGGVNGVPTGFIEFDELTAGLQPGQMIVVAARPAMGKALALDTEIPTPTGWTTMGQLAPGDWVLGADGKPTVVTAVTEVMNHRPCYRLTFDDGSQIIADAEHQWLTDAHASCKAKQVVLAGRHESQPTQTAVRTTEEIRATLHCATADSRVTHSITNTAALKLPEAELPLAPYTFGSWLGTSGNKHIPTSYLRASEAQRRALLAGLLDSGGTITTAGYVQFAVANRQLALDVQELLHSLGYRTGLSRKKVAGPSGASSTLYKLTFSTADQVFTLPHKRKMHRVRDARPSTKQTSRFIVSVEPVESVPVRCIQVDNESHLYLASRAFIPTHNSTFALDIARSAAIKHNMTTVFFSLEMSRNEIAMKILSAEASLNFGDLRKGKLDDDQWAKLATAVGKLDNAPLFIDDSPNMTMMEIRAKARRLKQRNNLQLIVLDYLQLMSSGKKVESRQQEVSEFSRSLKLMAKELEVPVIALSQLNRGSEQRTDKRPMVSDLRESGCLTADTRILRADTGAETTMGELYASGAKDVPVWSLNDNMRYVERHLTHVFSTGTKPVYRMKLASGKELRATANHPFFTYRGWKGLGELEVGSRIATPRHVNGPSMRAHWADEEVILLAHLLGDGSFVRRQPIRYASVDEQNLDVVTQAAQHFGITAVRDTHEAARCTSLRLPAPFHLTHGKRNPVAQWLEGLGLFGLRSWEKFIPGAVFALPKQQIALFIKHLWATDGSVTLTKKGRGGRIYYASTSRQLIDQLSLLLLRFGISTRIKQTTPKGEYRPGYTLDISGRDDQLRFLREIGVQGQRSENCARLLAALEAEGRKSNTNVDTVPVEVWQDVRDILSEKGMSHRQFQAAMGSQYCGSTFYKHAPSRSRLSQVATVLDSAQMDMVAVNDIFWDTVVSIDYEGEEEVFDATVLGHHNFVANGITVHNSIEQDADMVILLHREDVYDKESPRAGEADVIVAKHRGGPTCDIALAFQGHYSRFANMTHDTYSGDGF